MGAMWISGAAFYGTLSDFVGTNSGLALTKRHIGEMLGRDEQFEQYYEVDDDSMLRIRSEVFEFMAEHLLFCVGRLERRDNLFPMIGVFHKHKHNKRKSSIAIEINRLWVDFMKEQLARKDLKRGDKIDPTKFMLQCLRKYGRFGLQVADEIVTGSIIRQTISAIYGNIPSMSEWDNIIELQELFDNEGLSPMYGTFFDQRYIDFLNRNFDTIDKINWRKFEGLTAEYFDRLGFGVDIGPGRNDDGVDVRVWPSAEAKDAPPAIIVQCKRQKQQISKVVVKALYADVVSMEAQSGLIVTTSKLSPGAKSVCAARKYPLHEADRTLVRAWVEEMRKPGLGVGT